MVNGDPRRLNQILRQAIFTAVVLLVIICLPSILVFPTLLEAFSVQDIVIQETMSLLLWMLIPMFFRTIGDSMRGMLQGMGYLTSLGLANFLNRLVFFG